MRYLHLSLKFYVVLEIHLLALRILESFIPLHFSSICHLYVLVPSSELCCELELLLLLGTVVMVSTAVLLGARQFRSLSRIVLMVRGLEAGLGEVGTHLIGSFTFLESDLKATLASANTLQVILLDLGRNDVSSVRSLLESLLVAVGGKSSNINVDDLTSLRIVGSPLELSKCIFIIEMRGQEALLLLSGDLYRGRNILLLLPFVVIEASIHRTAAESMTIESGALLRPLHVGTSLRRLLLNLLLHIGSVQPVALRRHKALIRSLLRRAHGRTVDLMTNVVDVGLSLIEGLEL